jgi:cell division protein FtsQ
MQYRPLEQTDKGLKADVRAHVRTRHVAQTSAPPSLAWDIRLMRITTVILVMVTVILLSILTVQWLANRGVFAIERLQLSGDLQHINAATVRAQAKSKVAGSYFTLDLKAAQLAFEQLPWVRQAVVRRVWPHAMAVSIQAHQPVAYWTTMAEAGSGTVSEERLLNNYAEVFEANSDEVDDELPRLAGPAGRSARVWHVYGQLSDQLKQAGITSKPIALSLNTRSEWEAELDDGLSLSLGRDDERLWQRLAQYTGTLEQARAHLAALGQRSNWARIDLRHTQGYAIAMRKSAVADALEGKALTESANEATKHVTDAKPDDTITSMSKPLSLAKTQTNLQTPQGAAATTR